MINRYFGSKALLFSELLAEAGEIDNPMTGDVASLGERLASFIRNFSSDAYTVPGGDSLMMLLNSVASVGAHGVKVDHVRQVAMRRLAKMLEGAEREERAALIFGYLVGCLIVRRLIPLTDMTERHLAVAIQDVATN